MKIIISDSICNQDEFDFKQMEIVLNTLLFKVDESINNHDSNYATLREIEEKVEDNLRRLNNMIQEFKGLVSIVRAEKVRNG